METVDQVNSSTSSIDSNDSEFGYGKMLDKINSIIVNNNTANQNNTSQEEFKEQDLKAYKVLYRGINFSGYEFKESSNSSSNPKLQDAKHRLRRLFIKDSNDKTLNRNKQADYNSLGFSKFLKEQEGKCEEVFDLFKDVDDLVNDFDSKLNLKEKLDIDSKKQKISSYISPNGYKKAVKDLGKNYGNPILSLSKSANVAVEYADYGKSSSLKPNYRNKVNPKHRCVGQIDIFVFSNEEYNKISKDKDVDILRSVNKIAGKCAVERENKEVILDIKIDAKNFIGSIPVVYPKLNYSTLQSEGRENRYGIGCISNSKMLPKNEDLSKDSAIKNCIKVHFAIKAEELAKSYIKKIGGRSV